MSPDGTDPIVDTALPEQLPPSGEDQAAQAAQAAAAVNAAVAAQKALLSNPESDPKAASGVILMDLDRLAQPDPENPHAQQLLSHGHAHLM